MEGKESRKLSVCIIADEVAVSKCSQADAPPRRSSAYRASEFTLADDRLCQNQHLEGKADSNHSIVIDLGLSGTNESTTRSIESLRKKRLRRNKKKRESFRNMNRQDKRTRYSRVPNQTINTLEDKLYKVQQEHKYEKNLSMVYYRSYQKEKEKKLKLYRAPKSIERENLEACDVTGNLGKGAFGVCRKMIYRGITVAVKTYQDHVTTSSITWEASVINLFDHQGLPLLFGVCLEAKPYLMIMQFHGIDGKCITFGNAVQSSLVLEAGDWIRLFRETAEALLYVHKKGFLHNDIKGDNVLLSSQRYGMHPVLIDFGKCRKISNPKRYTLTQDEQRKYCIYHCHIAPELVKGTHCQSFKSDVYSYGFLLFHICKAISKRNDVLNDISIACMRKKPEVRPTLDEIVCKLK